MNNEEFTVLCVFFYFAVYLSSKDFQVNFYANIFII